MSFELSFEPGTALFWFFTIPILTLGISMLVYLAYHKLVRLGHPKALAWLIEPLKFKPLIRFKSFQKKEEENAQRNASGQRHVKKWLKFTVSQLCLRLLFFIIIGVFVFTAAMISLLFHESGHGIVTELLGWTWKNTEIYWLGGVTYILPPQLMPPQQQVMSTYFFFEDSLVRLGGDLVEFIMGTVFLLLLLVPQIRKSFFASIFCFAVSIAGMPAAVMDWYGGAWNVLYGNAIQGTDTQVFLYDQSLLPNGVSAVTLLQYTTAFLVISQLIVIVVSCKLWRLHYPDHRFSHYWFLALVELAWWFMFVVAGLGFVSTPMSITTHTILFSCL
ncbi:MAG TPA: hypothetical protein VKM55_09370 [Candidatus Lokiarchaeia archaeon]|nr:hypothetical protein [Candidatus Lokiarchaeia archaeon]